MATCAICQLELHRGDGIALAGSEAFHKACVRDHGIANSVVNRLKAKLLEVEALAVRQRDELRNKLDSVTEQLRKSGRRVSDMTSEIEAYRTIDTQLEIKKAELAGVRHELSALRAEFRELEAEGDILIAERDSARREAALHQLLAQNAPLVAKVITPEPVDDRDATEVRFSLLELDDLK